jgi:hypothetical protein
MIKLLIALTLLSFNLFSQEIKSTYIINQKSKSPAPIHILHLRDNNKYEVIDFITNNDVTVITGMSDTGTYIIKDKILFKTISFTSEKKKKFTLNKITYYINKDKLYEKPLDPYLRKPYKASITLDTAYQKTIPYQQNKKNNDIKKEYTKSFFLTNIKKYSPTYLDVITENYCGPGCYNRMISRSGQTAQWNGDTTYQELIGDYSTMTHETTHQHNRYLDYDWKTHLWTEIILVEPGITITYAETPTFHSELFISIVPKEAPKKIFRYDLYVSKGTFPSANVSGIYGLMDEFSAYRNGTRVSIEAANTAIKLNDKEKIKIFESHAIGEYFAYYEFRLFIAWYLEYAQKNKPDIYKKIMDNTNFRIAFTLLDDGFSNDLKELEKLVKKYPIYSYDVFEKENVEYLKTLLADHEKTLTKFKIEGVTKQNYKEKLK